MPVSRKWKNNIYYSWWFQPNWKICSSNWIFPQVGLKTKNIWNHRSWSNTVLVPWLLCNVYIYIYIFDNIPSIELTYPTYYRKNKHLLYYLGRTNASFPESNQVSHYIRRVTRTQRRNAAHHARSSQHSGRLNKGPAPKKGALKGGTTDEGIRQQKWQWEKFEAGGKFQFQEIELKGTNPPSLEFRGKTLGGMKQNSE